MALFCIYGFLYFIIYREPDLQTCPTDCTEKPSIPFVGRNLLFHRYLKEKS